MLHKILPFFTSIITALFYQLSWWHHNKR